MDREYYIRYKKNGILKEEKVGWWSKGITLLEANRIRGIITTNIRLGKRPQSIAEMREMDQAERERERLLQEQEEKKNISFGVFFEDRYMPASKLCKEENTIKSERSIFNTWIKPVIADLPIYKLELSHIETIVSNVTAENRSKRTIKYALDIISQVWNYAKKNNIVNGDSPSKLYKVGKLDNMRERALTKEEAEKLLIELGKINIDLKHICIIALYQGLRFGEIAKLRWNEINLENRKIYLADTKSGTSVTVNMRPIVQSILAERAKQKPSQEDLVFPAKGGQKKRERMSKTFRRVVKKLGFNDGITNRNQMVVFHTLRHTYATWLRENHVDLDRLKELTRHADYKSVLRYAHIGNEDLERNASTLDDIQLNVGIEIESNNPTTEHQIEPVAVRVRNKHEEELERSASTLDDIQLDLDIEKQDSTVAS